MQVAESAKTNRRKTLKEKKVTEHNKKYNDLLEKRFKKLMYPTFSLLTDACNLRWKLISCRYSITEIVLNDIPISPLSQYLSLEYLIRVTLPAIFQYEKYVRWRIRQTSLKTPYPYVLQES